MAEYQQPFPRVAHLGWYVGVFYRLFDNNLGFWFNLSHQNRFLFNGQEFLRELAEYQQPLPRIAHLGWYVGIFYRLFEYYFRFRLNLGYLGLAGRG